MGYYTTRKNQFVWKKIKQQKGGKEFLVSLMIPKGTKCYGSKTGKNRAAKAVPINFYENTDGSGSLAGYETVRLSNLTRIRHRGPGLVGCATTYTLNKEIKPKRPFATNSWVGECASGIHFFFNENDALNW